VDIQFKGGGAAFVLRDSCSGAANVRVQISYLPLGRRCSRTAMTIGADAQCGRRPTTAVTMVVADLDVDGVHDARLRTFVAISRDARHRFRRYIIASLRVR